MEFPELMCPFEIVPGRHFREGRVVSGKVTSTQSNPGNAMQIRVNKTPIQIFMKEKICNSSVDSPYF
jgi:hypothetical protein